MQKVVISTDKSLLDVNMIHSFLSEQARWSIGIPRATVEKAIENSLCFGAYQQGRQVGFARVVTDYATFGNLVDVFVLPHYQGQGIARTLLETIVGYPDLARIFHHRSRAVGN